MMPLTGSMTLAAVVALACAAASLMAIVALRLCSPGAARFWLGPAFVAAALMSLVGLATLVTGAAAELWHAKELLDCLMAAAMTGTPCSR